MNSTSALLASTHAVLPESICMALLDSREVAPDPDPSRMVQRHFHPATPSLPPREPVLRAGETTPRRRDLVVDEDRGQPLAGGGQRFGATSSPRRPALRRDLLAAAAGASARPSAAAAGAVARRLSVERCGDGAGARRRAP